MIRYPLGGLFVFCILFVACQGDDFPNMNPDQEIGGGNGNPGGGGQGNNGNNVFELGDFALPDVSRDPVGNASTNLKVELGRMLFWDPILSGTKDVSCATCHHPDFGYADGLDLSIGVHGMGLGPQRQNSNPNEAFFAGRNAPTVLNTAFNGMDENGVYVPETGVMFWDLRANGLEEQALLPPSSFEEMRGDAYAAEDAIDSVILRLAAINEYQGLFSQAFGGAASINEANLSRALAAFQRSLVSNNSPFDRYVAGEATAMSNQAIDGFERFIDVGCANCHSGPMFSDFETHVLGVPDNDKLPQSDAGENGSYAFRTPTLRNVGITGPYFHSGRADDLEEVLEFYIRIQGNGNGGGGRGALPINPNVNQLDDELRDLQLRQQDIDDIEAFLLALTDADFDDRIPTRVPSGLTVGGNIALQ